MLGRPSIKREAVLSVKAVACTHTRGTGKRYLHASRCAAEEDSGRPPSKVPSQRSESHRFLADDRVDNENKRSHRIQFNSDPFSLRPPAEHLDFPLVKPDWLAKQSQRPRGVRMLARDFIHDSLYNPQYGYFSRHAVLLPDGKQKRSGSYDFRALANERAFARAVQERYTAFEEEMTQRDAAAKKAFEERIEARVRETLEPLRRHKEAKEAEAKAAKEGKLEDVKTVSPKKSSKDKWMESLSETQRKGRTELARQLLNEKETGKHDRDVMAMAARQVWHTPTELFKPYYAHAVARYMLDTRPKHLPLRVYEVGAGSGALARDILDYLEAEHRDVYESMTYHIIEISPRLAQQQRLMLTNHINSSHRAEPRVTISNRSVLDWKVTDEKPCFFLAMEVFDNLTHDVVRYDVQTLAPMQAFVSIDSTGDMQELWVPATDTLIRRYLNMTQGSNTPASTPQWMKYVPDAVRRATANTIPFYPNMTPAHYVPTGSLQLLDVLARHFPRHRLIMADFDQLPDSLDGVNAPVVQTRLGGTMIPVTTYMVHQGFFDIFFPTDFDDLRHVHRQIRRKAAASDDKGEHAPARIMSHRAFLEQYADVPQTTCQDGSNPMLSWYGNASWYLS